MVWFCFKYPSFSYIQNTHHSQELPLKAIRFISLTPAPPKHNLKQYFDLASETCFFLLCLPFSKQLKVCWEKTSLCKPPRCYFWYHMCYFPVVVLWFGLVNAQKTAQVLFHLSLDLAWNTPTLEYFLLLCICLFIFSPCLIQRKLLYIYLGHLPKFLC